MGCLDADYKKILRCHQWYVIPATTYSLLTPNGFFSSLGMLNHQIDFSKAVADLYRPISGRVSDPDSIVDEGNTEGIRACEEYEAIVRDLLATLQPELEMIETRVIRPADELL